MSVLSMTGYGSATFEVEGQRYRIDVKSVNHKGMSVRLRMPSEFAAAETPARKRIGDALGRGAVDLNVSRDGESNREIEVHVDRDGVHALMSTLQKLARELHAPEPTLELVLHKGDFVEVQRKRTDAEALTAGLLGGLDEALAQLVEMRRVEGEELATDISGRLDTLEALIERVETVAPTVYEAYKERLVARLEDAQARIGAELEPSRIATELVLFADKSDVTEELVRARTHIQHFRDILGNADAESGKRMDFLAQELFRELNTIGSKCRDAGMAAEVVDGKVELEKIREQVANIA